MTHVRFHGSAVEVLGTFPQVGDTAPDFDLVAADLSPIRLSELAGKKVLLNIFPSIDTSVCAVSVRKFNQAASDENATVLCVSADLPFAAGRFCAAEGIDKVQTASFFRAPDFCARYGVQLTGKLAGLSARAVVVINAKGDVVYSELVEEVSDEPNYGAALSALQNA